MTGNRMHVVQKFILQFHSKNPAELVLLYNCYHCAVEVKTNYLILYACYDHEFLSCVPQLWFPHDNVVYWWYYCVLVISLLMCIKMMVAKPGFRWLDVTSVSFSVFTLKCSHCMGSNHKVSVFIRLSDVGNYSCGVCGFRHYQE